MSDAFDPKDGPIFVTGEITGPNRSARVHLILDTGATNSLINQGVLALIGFDLAAPASPADRVELTTGSGVEQAAKVVLTRFSTLGQHRFGFRVVARELPPEAGVDGLLGLDFFRARSSPSTSSRARSPWLERHRSPAHASPGVFFSKAWRNPPGRRQVQGWSRTLDYELTSSAAWTWGGQLAPDDALQTSSPRSTVTARPIKATRPPSTRTLTTPPRQETWWPVSSDRPSFSCQ
jgi:hypothetical protein